MHHLVHKILTWNVVLGVIGLSTWLTAQVQSGHEQGMPSAMVAYAPQQAAGFAAAHLPANSASAVSTRATLLARR